MFWKEASALYQPRQLVWINKELKPVSLTYFSTPSAWMGNYSRLPAFRVAGRVELFAGPALNFINGSSDFTTRMTPKESLWNQIASVRIGALHIGYI